MLFNDLVLEPLVLRLQCSNLRVGLTEWPISRIVLYEQNRGEEYTPEIEMLKSQALGRQYAKNTSSKKDHQRKMFQENVKLCTNNRRRKQSQTVPKNANPNIRAKNRSRLSHELVIPIRASSVIIVMSQSLYLHEKSVLYKYR